MDLRDNQLMYPPNGVINAGIQQTLDYLKNNGVRI